MSATGSTAKGTVPLKSTRPTASGEKLESATLTTARRGTTGSPWNIRSSIELARDQLLEAIAILLLGLGGLILPFPFWPVGAIVAMFLRDTTSKSDEIPFYQKVA